MEGRRTAIVTGGSRGLGLALVRSLAAAGWNVVTDGRDAAALGDATAGLGDRVVAIAGDVTDAGHRRGPGRRRRRARGRSTCSSTTPAASGRRRCPALADYPLDALADLFAVNVVAPIGLIQAALPHLGRGAVVVDITSDASVEAYEGWGGYGATKAALDHVGRVLAAERPDAAGAERRPRRHAHPDAPGRLPRRGHLRPPAARGQRPGDPRPRRWRPAERPVPRQRGGGGVSTLATTPTSISITSCSLPSWRPPSRRS